MRQCEIQQRGAVELYFYDELDPAARAEMTTHVQQCRECAIALADLRMIRAVLATKDDVSAPPAGDWSGFMRRLNHSVTPGAAVTGRRHPLPATAAFLVATAALLTLVTVAVYFAAKGRSDYAAPQEVVVSAPSDRAVATAGLKAVGEQHFERAKLVVLGLAAKEPHATRMQDWSYERELASSLLDDTRLYRLAAEENGYTSLAGVMRDLELVLLATSMADNGDRQALGQIQRLIEKRALIEKMHTAATVGM